MVVGEWTDDNSKGEGSEALGVREVISFVVEGEPIRGDQDRRDNQDTRMNKRRLDGKQWLKEK